MAPNNLQAFIGILEVRRIHKSVFERTGPQRPQDGNQSKHIFVDSETRDALITYVEHRRSA